MSEARLRPTLGDGRADCQRPCLCMSGRRPHRLSAVTAFQITLLVTSQECETQKPVAHPRCTLRGGDRRHAARPGEVSRGGRGASPHPRAHGPELRAPFSVVARPDRHRSLWQPAVPWQREPGAAGAAVGGGGCPPRSPHWVREPVSDAPHPLCSRGAAVVSGPGQRPPASVSSGGQGLACCAGAQASSWW